MDAIAAIGGNRPLKAEEFARRAYNYALNPARNPLKETLDQCESVAKTPPLLGGFNDVPWHKLRDAEVHAWAKAGWSWLVNDAEHSQWEGWYGREQNAVLARHGILPVQRLAREARSEHGDAFQLGARATMRPLWHHLRGSRALLPRHQLPRPRPSHPRRPRRISSPRRRADHDVHARRIARH